jgi:hypothetical protein
MGRWATVRRRSSSSVSASALGPPPAPSLAEVGGFLIQTNSGVNNSDGLCTLYQSPNGIDEWAFVEDFPWQLVFDWGEVGILPEEFLAVTSTGNGIVYVGESARSNTFDNTGA